MPETDNPEENEQHQQSGPDEPTSPQGDPPPQDPPPDEPQDPPE